MGAAPKDGNPHDTLFCRVFERPEEAAGLLRVVLPARLVRHLDLSRVRLSSTRFVDPVVGTRTADMLYEVPLVADAECVVHVVVEHQSSAEARMLHRMLDYGLRGVDRGLRQSGVARLPALVPVLVWQESGGYPGPTRLTELLGLPADVRSALGDLVIEHRVVVYDLTRVSDRAIMRSRATSYGRLALLLLKHGRARGLVARMERQWGALLRRVWRERGAGAIETVARYALAVGDEDIEGLRAAVERALGPRGGEVVMSTAEKLRQEGLEQGLEQGRAEALLRQLRLKFADVPAETQARVRAGSPADLDRWLDRVLTAETLEDVFGA